MPNAKYLIFGIINAPDESPLNKIKNLKRNLKREQVVNYKPKVLFKPFTIFWKPLQIKSYIK